MPLSPEDLAELTKSVGEALIPTLQESITSGAGKLVNDAITKRLGQFEKSIGSQIGETVTKALDGFKAAQPRAGAPAEGGETPSATDPMSVALKSLEARLKEAEQRSQAQEQRANAERAKNRNSTLRGTLQEQLAKAGISDPTALRLAVGHLVDAEKRVSYENADEDEAPILFKADDGSMLDLPTGIARWLKTPEAKFYIPATGTRGSGASAPRSPALQPGQQPSRERQLEAVGNAFFEALGR
jgi:hypothetical protein